MSQLSPEQCLKIAQALESVGHSTAGLKPISPWAVDTPKAHLLRTYIQAADPTLAAELANESSPPSLSYLALMEKAKYENIDVSTLDPDLMDEVMLRNSDELQ